MTSPVIALAVMLLSLVLISVAGIILYRIVWQFWESWRLRKKGYKHISEMINDDPTYQGNMAKTLLPIFKKAGLVEYETRKVKSYDVDLFGKRKTVVLDDTKAIGPQKVKLSEDKIIVVYPKKLAEGKKPIENSPILEKVLNEAGYINGRLVPRKIKEELNTYHYLIRTKRDPIFEGKGTLLQNIQVFNEKVGEPLRAKTAKNGVEYLFLGELSNPYADYDQLISLPLDTNPYLIIVGRPGSGKTKTALSLLTSLKLTYGDRVKIGGIADGKQTADFDPLSEYVSELPVAKLGGDGQIELANVLKEAYDEMSRRQRLLTKEALSTITDYNNKYPDNPIPRYVVIVDEFAQYGADYAKEADTPSSVSWFLNKLLRLGRALNVSVILMSQRFQSSDFPTPLRSQFGLRLVHRVDDKDKAFNKVEGITLQTGEFALVSDEINCRTNPETIITSRLPFIGDGDTPEKTYQRVFGEKIDTTKKRDFDYEMIYATKSNKGIESLGKKELNNYILRLFLAQEGYEIFEKNDPASRYISFKAKKGETYYCGGVMEPSEISDKFMALVEDEMTGDTNPYQNYLFFIKGKMKTADRRSIQEGMFPKRWTFISSDDGLFKRLNQAFENYNNSQNSTEFEELLGFKEMFETQEEESQESIQNLKDIIKDKNTSRKGDNFERYYAEILRQKGYTYVQRMEKLKERGLVKFPGGYGDGGTDIVAKKDNTLLLVQNKCYKGGLVPVQSVSDFVGRVSLVIEKLKLAEIITGNEEVMLEFVSTSDFSPHCFEVEKVNKNLKLINKNMLNNMIKKLGSQKETNVIELEPKKKRRGRPKGSKDKSQRKKRQDDPSKFLKGGSDE